MMKMPPEWHPQTCVWVSPPHAPDTWPGCLDQAQAQFAHFLDKLRTTTPVRDVAELGIRTDDSWIRDYGPIFIIGDGRLAAHDFRFNNWGGKYGDFSNDDAAAQKILEHENIPYTRHDFILEGGSLEVAGDGTLLTTEQCLLNPHRNAKLTKKQIEAKLIETLGVERIVWLPGGIAGDDTDGHIDDVARFIADGVVAVVSPNENHPDHAMMRRNHDALRGLPGVDVLPIPAPPPLWFDDPAEGRRMLPCSYVNFLISNGQVLVPVFGQRSDDAALDILAQALPRYRIEPIRAETLVVGYGALHCLTMQQPDAARGARREARGAKVKSEK